MSPRRLPATLFFCFAWLIGAALRLSYPGDIEYKGDEAWMFHAVQGVLQGHDWPAIGMDSSAGIANPGLSVWVFVPLGKLFGTQSPVDLARGVEGLNVLALTMLFAFAASRQEPERPLWLWTAALAAVDPLGIILQRKIWAQSVLPIFVVSLFLVWRMRSTLLGAFFWGLLGALPGQIHMSGFFFAFIFVLWSLVEHIRGKHRARWLPWFVGSVLGSLPMIPWLKYLKESRPGLAHWPPPPAWLGGNPWRIWAQDSVAWGLNYSLGDGNLKRFATFPLFHHNPTHLMQGCLYVTVAIAVILAASSLWRLIRERTGVLERLRGDGVLGHNLAFFGYCGLMTVLPLTFYRHYLLIVFPFVSMSLPLLARLGRRGGGWLFIHWVAMAALSCGVMWFLHVNHGAPGGDYGTGYQFQPGRP